MKILLSDVRLAFPVLWKAKAIQDGEPAFSASFILTPDNPAIKVLNDAFAKVAKEQWGDKAEAILKGLKAQDRLALHDGATKARTRDTRATSSCPRAARPGRPCSTAIARHCRSPTASRTPGAM